MIDLFSLYQDFQSRVNTSQNSFFRPQTDFERACNEISINLWNEWTNIAEKSQEARDKLFPFLKSSNRVVNGQNTYYGIAEPPKNYGRYASSRLIVHGQTCLPCKTVDDGECEGFESQEEITDKYYDDIKEVPVINVDNQRWGAFLEHCTKGPSLERPGLTQINNQFRVAPRKVSVIVLDYYVQPAPATFVYSLSPGNTQTGGGDQIIYDANASKKLEWPESVRPEFLDALVEWFIAFTRDGNFSQINAQQKRP